MSSQLQQSTQAQIDEATKDVNNVPGCVFYATDRQGRELAYAAGGVRQAGKDEPMPKDAIFWIASCTKLLTAIALLQLVERGKVSLDDDASKYCSELADAKLMDGSAPKHKPTVWNLITHTCGQGYPFFNREVKKWFDSKSLSSFACSKSSITAPLVAEPGSEWHYATGIDWVGQLIERVSGQSLNDYMQENILEPVGAKNMSFLPESAGLLPRLAGMNFRATSDGSISGIPHWMPLQDSKVEVQYGGAGLFANPRDYCQVLAALVNKGTHPVTGNQILKPDSVELLKKDQLTGKLQQDLTKDLPDAIPELTNPIVELGAPGLPKNWAFGGLKVNSMSSQNSPRILHFLLLPSRLAL